MSGVPEIDYDALIAACFARTKAQQGTRGCVQFANGAEWFREQVVAAEAPIDMILHCPACGMQHIDKPEWVDDSDPRNAMALVMGDTWTNPPHRSHLCHGCGHIWRPADVCTNGVQEIATKGKADSPDVEFLCETEAQGFAIEAIHQFCPELRFREDGQTLLTPAQVEMILRRMGWKAPSERKPRCDKCQTPNACADACLEACIEARIGHLKAEIAQLKENTNGR